MIIETERLILREFEPSEYDALNKVLADSDIKKLLDFRYSPSRLHYEDGL